MLPRRERLTRAGAFRAIVARGRTFRGGYLVLHFLPRSGGPSRLGVSAGKKVGGAVQRNRAKRLLREAFRSLKCDLAGTYHLVLVARSAAARSTLNQVRDELRLLMESARILRCPQGTVRERAGE